MKLNCEKNTEAMRKRVLSAFRSRYGIRKANAIYEHGQWWVDEPQRRRQWSVCDAEGPGSTQGFSFEQIS